MKKLILSNSLFFVTFSLFAQVDSISCSTIVLGNDKEISAFIHSIESGYLYYQRCADTTSHRYSIPVEYIKLINGTRGFQDSLASQITDLSKIDFSKSKSKKLRKWIFKKNNNNNNGIFASDSKSIKEKQRVRVDYRDYRFNMRKVRGKWKTLTEDDLILEMKNGSTVTISRDKIVKIDIIKYNILLRLLGFILGLYAIIMLFLFRAIAGLGIVPKEYLLLMLVLGIASGIILLSTKPKYIDYPFNGKWEITSPSSEQNDVKEVYYQP
jgi:hypothetical protein